MAASRQRCPEETASRSAARTSYGTGSGASRSGAAGTGRADGCRRDSTRRWHGAQRPATMHRHQAAPRRPRGTARAPSAVPQTQTRVPGWPSASFSAEFTTHASHYDERKGNPPSGSREPANSGRLAADRPGLRASRRQLCTKRDSTDGGRRAERGARFRAAGVRRPDLFGNGESGSVQNPYSRHFDNRIRARRDADAGLVELVEYQTAHLILHVADAVRAGHETHR